MKTIESFVKVPPPVCSIFCPSALASFLLHILQRHRITFSGYQLVPPFIPPFPANAGHLPRMLTPQQSLCQMPVYSTNFKPKLSLIPPADFIVFFSPCTLYIAIIACVFTCGNIFLPFSLFEESFPCNERPCYFIFISLARRTSSVTQQTSLNLSPICQ